MQRIFEPFERHEPVKCNSLVVHMPYPHSNQLGFIYIALVSNDTNENHSIVCLDFSFIVQSQNYKTGHPPTCISGQFSVYRSILTSVFVGDFVRWGKKESDFKHWYVNLILWLPSSSHKVRILNHLNRSHRRS
jgi:hypothetical protein